MRKMDLIKGFLACHNDVSQMGLVTIDGKDCKETFDLTFKADVKEDFLPEGTYLYTYGDRFYDGTQTHKEDAAILDNNNERVLIYRIEEDWE